MRKFPFKRNVLSNQKILKKKTKNEKKKKHFQHLRWFLVLSILCFSYLGIKRSLNFLSLSKLRPEKNLNPSWTISLPHSYKNFSHKDLESFVEKNQNSSRLKLLTEKLEATFYFSDSTLIQTRQKHLEIHAKEREPLFYILADKSRLVSKKGEVYGLYKTNYKNLPQLSNILDKNRKSFSLSKNKALKLSKTEIERIQEALLILRVSGNSSLGLKTLTYIPYRGFQASFYNNESVVILGRKPFKEKFIKLKEVYNQLKRKGQKAKLIELDYEGKAFIKTGRVGDQVDT